MGGHEFDNFWVITRMKKQTFSWYKKSTAFFVLISFTLFNLSINPGTSYAQHLIEGVAPANRADLGDPAKVFDSLSLSGDLGTIQEKFIPQGVKSDQFIIYLQDAHTNYDSETNIRKLIHLFQKQYGLPLVLLEGGEGKLDSLFFKSFPDEKVKEKILNDYVSKGELSGGEIASILNEEFDTDYYGIETQALYNENKQAFLDAIQKEKEISNRLDQIESGLTQKGESSFSENVKTFHEKQKAFRGESIDLMEYLKTLKTLGLKQEGGSFEDRYPELNKILAAESNEKSFKGEEFDAAMTQLIRAFQQKVLTKLPKAKQIEINQMIQLYRIGQVSQGMLVNRIEEVSKEMNFNPRVPQVLKPTAQHARMLSSLKGTKLFEELETLEGELIQSLPKSEEEKALLKNFYDLEMLRNFAKLELRDKDWQYIKSNQPSSLLKGEETLDPLFTAHYRFYQLAEKRDEALFKNMLQAMKNKKTKLSVVVTGGFHSEGITKKLKDSNIPFILIAPTINKVGDMAQYMNVMQGKISYMRYFKGSLWDALAQDYAAKLAASLKKEELTPSLKRWRDRIIQNSIAEGRITQATSYTKYVDALVQALRKEFEKGSAVNQLSEDEIKAKLSKELDSFLDTYFDKLQGLIKQKLEFFSTGLEELWRKKDVTPKSVGDLLNRMNGMKTSGLAVQLALAIREGTPTAGIYREGKKLGLTKKNMSLAVKRLKELGLEPEQLRSLLANYQKFVKAQNAVLSPEERLIAQILAGATPEDIGQVQKQIVPIPINFKPTGEKNIEVNVKPNKSEQLTVSVAPPKAGSKRAATEVPQKIPVSGVPEEKFLGRILGSNEQRANAGVRAESRNTKQLEKMFDESKTAFTLALAGFFNFLKSEQGKEFADELISTWNIVSEQALNSFVDRMNPETLLEIEQLTDIPPIRGSDLRKAVIQFAEKDDLERAVSVVMQHILETRKENYDDYANDERLIMASLSRPESRVQDVFQIMSKDGRETSDPNRALPTVYEVVRDVRAGMLFWDPETGQVTVRDSVGVKGYQQWLAQARASDQAEASRSLVIYSRTGDEQSDPVLPLPTPLEFVRDVRAGMLFWDVKGGRVTAREFVGPRGYQQWLERARLSQEDLKRAEARKILTEEQIQAILNKDIQDLTLKDVGNVVYNGGSSRLESEGWSFTPFNSERGFIVNINNERIRVAIFTRGQSSETYQFKEFQRAENPDAFNSILPAFSPSEKLLLGRSAHISALALNPRPWEKIRAESRVEIGAKDLESIKSGLGTLQSNLQNLQSVFSGTTENNAYDLFSFQAYHVNELLNKYDVHAKDIQEHAFLFHWLGALIHHMSTKLPESETVRGKVGDKKKEQFSSNLKQLNETIQQVRSVLDRINPSWEKDQEDIIRAVADHHAAIDYAGRIDEYSVKRLEELNATGRGREASLQKITSKFGWQGMLWFLTTQRHGVWNYYGGGDYVHFQARRILIDQGNTKEELLGLRGRPSGGAIADMKFYLKLASLLTEEELINFVYSSPFGWGLAAQVLAALEYSNRHYIEEFESLNTEQKTHLLDLRNKLLPDLISKARNLQDQGAKSVRARSILSSRRVFLDATMAEQIEIVDIFLSVLKGNKYQLLDYKDVAKLEEQQKTNLLLGVAIKLFAAILHWDDDTTQEFRKQNTEKVAQIKGVLEAFLNAAGKTVTEQLAILDQAINVAHNTEKDPFRKKLLSEAQQRWWKEKVKERGTVVDHIASGQSPYGVKASDIIPARLDKLSGLIEEITREITFLQDYSEFSGDASVVRRRLENLAGVLSPMLLFSNKNYPFRSETRSKFDTLDTRDLLVTGEMGKDAFVEQITDLADRIGKAGEGTLRDLDLEAEGLIKRAFPQSADRVLAAYGEDVIARQPRNPNPIAIRQAHADSLDALRAAVSGEPQNPQKDGLIRNEARTWEIRWPQGLVDEAKSIYNSAKDQYPAQGPMTLVFVHKSLLANPSPLYRGEYEPIHLKLELKSEQDEASVFQEEMIRAVKPNLKENEKGFVAVVTNVGGPILMLNPVRSETRYRDYFSEGKGFNPNLFSSAVNETKGLPSSVISKLPPTNWTVFELPKLKLPKDVILGLLNDEFDETFKQQPKIDFRVDFDYGSLQKIVYGNLLNSLPKFSQEERNKDLVLFGKYGDTFPEERGKPVEVEKLVLWIEKNLAPENKGPLAIAIVEYQRAIDDIFDKNGTPDGNGLFPIRLQRKSETVDDYHRSILVAIGRLANAMSILLALGGPNADILNGEAESIGKHVFQYESKLYEYKTENGISTPRPESRENWSVDTLNFSGREILEELKKVDDNPTDNLGLIQSVSALSRIRDRVETLRAVPNLNENETAQKAVTAFDGKLDALRPKTTQQVLERIKAVNPYQSPASFKNDLGPSETAFYATRDWAGPVFYEQIQRALAEKELANYAFLQNAWLKQGKGGWTYQVPVEAQGIDPRDRWARIFIIEDAMRALKGDMKSVESLKKKAQTKREQIEGLLTELAGNPNAYQDIMDLGDSRDKIKQLLNKILAENPVIAREPIAPKEPFRPVPQPKAQLAPPRPESRTRATETETSIQDEVLKRLRQVGYSADVPYFIHQVLQWDKIGSVFIQVFEPTVFQAGGYDVDTFSQKVRFPQFKNVPELRGKTNGLFWSIYGNLLHGKPGLARTDKIELVKTLAKTKGIVDQKNYVPFLDQFLTAAIDQYRKSQANEKAFVAAIQTFMAQGLKPESDKDIMRAIQTTVKGIPEDVLMAVVRRERPPLLQPDPKREKKEVTKEVKSIRSIVAMPPAVALTKLKKLFAISEETHLPIRGPLVNAIRLALTKGPNAPLTITQGELKISKGLRAESRTRATEAEAKSSMVTLRNVLKASTPGKREYFSFDILNLLKDLDSAEIYFTEVKDILSAVDEKIVKLKSEILIQLNSYNKNKVFSSSGWIANWAAILSEKGWKRAMGRTEAINNLISDDSGLWLDVDSLQLLLSEVTTNKNLIDNSTFGKPLREDLQKTLNNLFELVNRTTEFLQRASNAEKDETIKRPAIDALGKWTSLRNQIQVARNQVAGRAELRPEVDQFITDAGKVTNADNAYFAMNAADELVKALSGQKVSQAEWEAIEGQIQSVAQATSSQFLIDSRDGVKKTGNYETLIGIVSPLNPSARIETAVNNFITTMEQAEKQKNIDLAYGATAKLVKDLVGSTVSGTQAEAIEQSIHNVAQAMESPTSLPLFHNDATTLLGQVKPVLPRRSELRPVSVQLIYMIIAMTAVAVAPILAKQEAAKKEEERKSWKAREAARRTRFEEHNTAVATALGLNDEQKRELVYERSIGRRQNLFSIGQPQFDRKLEGLRSKDAGRKLRKLSEPLMYPTKSRIVKRDEEALKILEENGVIIPWEIGEDPIYRVYYPQYMLEAYRSTLLRYLQSVLGEPTITEKILGRVGRIFGSRSESRGTAAQLMKDSLKIAGVSAVVGIVGLTIALSLAYLVYPKTPTPVLVKEVIKPRAVVKIAAAGEVRDQDGNVISRLNEEGKWEPVAQTNQPSAEGVRAPSNLTGGAVVKTAAMSEETKVVKEPLDLKSGALVITAGRLERTDEKGNISLWNDATKQWDLVPGKRNELRTQVKVSEKAKTTAANEVGKAIADRWLKNLGLLEEGKKPSSLNLSNVRILYRSGLNAREAKDLILPVIRDRLNERVSAIRQDADQKRDSTKQQLWEKLSSLSDQDVWKAFLDAAKLPRIASPQDQKFNQWVEKVENLSRSYLQVNVSAPVAGFESVAEIATPEVIALTDSYFGAFKNAKGLVEVSALKQFQGTLAKLSEKDQTVAAGNFLSFLRSIIIVNPDVRFRVVVTSPNQKQIFERRLERMVNQRKDQKLRLSLKNQIIIVVEGKELAIARIAAPAVMTITDDASQSFPGAKAFDAKVYADGTEIKIQAGHVIPEELVSVALVALSQKTFEGLVKRDDVWFRAAYEAVLTGLRLFAQKVTAEAEAKIRIALAA